MVVLVAENKTRQARIEMVNPLTFYAACDGGADTVALHRVQGRHGWGCAVVGEVGTRLAWEDYANQNQSASGWGPKTRKAKCLVKTVE